jgi:hypothetical protein
MNPTRQQIEEHLAQGGTVIEEVSGRQKPDHNFRLTWSNPATQPFHNTPQRMATHLWERQQWLGTSLTLVPLTAEQYAASQEAKA